MTTATTPDAGALTPAELVTQGLLAGREQYARHQVATQARLSVDEARWLWQALGFRHGGTVIKNLGDEVLFVAADPRAAAEIALTLLERADSEYLLPPLHAGLAYGPVLDRAATPSTCRSEPPATCGATCTCTATGSAEPTPPPAPRARQPPRCPRPVTNRTATAGRSRGPEARTRLRKGHGGRPDTATARCPGRRRCLRAARPARPPPTPPATTGTAMSSSPGRRPSAQAMTSSEDVELALWLAPGCRPCPGAPKCCTCAAIPTRPPPTPRSSSRSTPPSRQSPPCCTTDALRRPPATAQQQRQRRGTPRIAPGPPAVRNTTVLHWQLT